MMMMFSSGQLWAINLLLLVPASGWFMGSFFTVTVRWTCSASCGVEATQLSVLCPTLIHPSDNMSWTVFKEAWWNKAGRVGSWSDWIWLNVWYDHRFRYFYELVCTSGEAWSNCTTMWGLNLPLVAKLQAFLDVKWGWVSRVTAAVGMRRGAGFF